MRSSIITIVGVIFFATIIIYVILKQNKLNSKQPVPARIDSVAAAFIPDSTTTAWKPPDIGSLTAGNEAELIRYGEDLIANTSKYLGPKGSVAQISNGMNCQNCHMDAGRRHLGNSFGAVASTYPKYRERSGRVESIAYRVNECMERSMNGSKLDSLSKELQAMVAYLNWIGKDVPKGTKPYGTGTPELPYLNRAADTSTGKVIFANKCQSCHGAAGQGIIKQDSTGYFYPPLWGRHSYNVSAGLYRLSAFAGFVKYNMPYTPAHTAPRLTNEEAWDVAAFVNSQPRPEKFFNYDWKNIAAKPVDYPFGPYADSFTAVQHKYGPYISMKRNNHK